jgi:hypothetical protein
MHTVTHRLKPHHVILLSNYIIQGDGGEHYIRSTINDFEHYPQYEEIYRKDHEREGVPTEYDQEFVDSLVEYCKGVASDPDAEITVVDGPDSLCSLGCNRSNGTCKESSEESKRDLMEAYGLGIGDVFTVSDISE